MDSILCWLIFIGISLFIVRSFNKTIFQKKTLKLYDIFMFKKMFFKKTYGNIVNKVILIHMFLILVFTGAFLFFILDDIYFLLYDEAFKLLINYFIVIVIIRLIFEVIVIPSMQRNANINQMYSMLMQNQSSPDSANMGQQQTAYTVPVQNQTYTNNLDDSVEKQDIADDSEKVYCSQCGTLYDAQQEKCPNCGMI